MKKMANIENGKWKIGIVGVTIFYCLLSPCAVSAIAAFLDTPATARLAALGGSYVALADDADDALGLINDGNTADAALRQQHRDLLHTGVRADRDDFGCHDVLGLHDRLPPLLSSA